jgi:cytidylate kinase
MTSNNLFDRCKAYLNSQAFEAVERPHKMRPAVTLSRMAGSRGVILGEKLALYLQEKTNSEDFPWTVFDKNLINKVLEDNELPSRLEKYVPEDATNELEATIKEILGLHPSLWTLVQKTSETLFNIARKGNAILVGRGGNIITSSLRNVFHIRLIGSLEERVSHVMSRYHCSEKEALTNIKETDAAREAYVRKYFDCAVDNPLQYHITLNTDGMPDAWIVQHLGNMILDWKALNE